MIRLFPQLLAAGSRAVNVSNDPLATDEQLIEALHTRDAIVQELAVHPEPQDVLPPGILLLLPSGALVVV